MSQKRVKEDKVSLSKLRLGMDKEGRVIVGIPQKGKGTFEAGKTKDISDDFYHLFDIVFKVMMKKNAPRIMELMVESGILGKIQGEMPPEGQALDALKKTLEETKSGNGDGQTITPGPEPEEEL